MIVRYIKSGQTSEGCQIPRWMKFALNEQGVEEIDGPKANPRILEYFKSAKFWGMDDSTAKNAWCGCFVAWVMDKAGYDIATEAFRAKEWMNRWPAGRRIEKPIYGAVAVMVRKGGGHVGFVMGSIPGKPHLLAILGGNQSDEVNVTAFPQDYFEAFMVPKAYDASNCTLLPYIDEYENPLRLT